jgi:nucleotide-binding universal stress UspA family protein
MFDRIMVPVDLAHVEDLDRALTLAGRLAREHGAEVCYVGVTAPPGASAEGPEAFAAALEAFARAQGDAHGIRTKARMVVAEDPAVTLDSALLAALEESGADLVVMATHRPGLGDWIWPSAGIAVARHAKASVFLVR